MVPNNSVIYTVVIAQETMADGRTKYLMVTIEGFLNRDGHKETHTDYYVKLEGDFNDSYAGVSYEHLLSAKKIYDLITVDTPPSHSY